MGKEHAFNVRTYLSFFLIELPHSGSLMCTFAERSKVSNTQHNTLLPTVKCLALIKSLITLPQP